MEEKEAYRLITLGPSPSTWALPLRVFRGRPYFASTELEPLTRLIFSDCSAFWVGAEIILSPVVVCAAFRNAFHIL